MDPGEIRIEDVLEKWEKYHPPPCNKANDEKPWYEQPLTEYANVNPRRRSRRRVLKNSAQDYVNDGHLLQKRFRVIPPVVDINIKNYKISQCNKCQSTLQYLPLASKEFLKSQTSSLFDSIIAAKSLIKWCGARFFQSILLTACYQSKDEKLLKQINQKSHPVLLVHDLPMGSLSTLLVYIFCASFGKVPYTIMRDEDILSPLLKYFMKKMGFIFIEKHTDDNHIHSIADKIIDLLKVNNHVLIGMQEDIKPSCNILYNVLDRLRKDEKLQKHILLSATTVSIEKDFNLHENTSLLSIIQKWFCFPMLFRGLAQFNISRSLKLQSFLKVAAELNQQDVSDEENGLIQRHLAFDLLQTGAILPTNLVSFLFVTKYRDPVSFDELITSVEWLIKELQNMDRFLGFSGETKDITDHALHLLQHEGVLELDMETKMIFPKTKSRKSLEKLFMNSKKMIHVFMIKAIMASSIVACVGGRRELYQGSGYNIQCRGDKILEKAEYLGEIVSFLLDYSCPFNEISDILVDSLEKMVTLDVLSTYTDTYESQSHQKLVHSVAMNSGWEEEEDNAATEVESEVYYNVSVEDDVVQLLDFLHACIEPFIEISFTIIAFIREYGEGTEFSVSMINEDLLKRFNNGFFLYGEMVMPNIISRVLDYLFEKMIIDDVEDRYVLSTSFSPGNGELEKLLQEIALFR